VQELETKLRLTKLNCAPKEFVNLESYITNLKRELTCKILKEKKIKSKEDNMFNFINDLLLNLNAEDKVLVLADKTNRYVTMTLENCRMLMLKNLEENADTIDAKEVRKFKGEEVKMLERLQHILSNNKCIVVRNEIDSCIVPIPRLLFKGYKKKDSEENFPSRLIVLVLSFNSRSFRLRYNKGMI